VVDDNEINVMVAQEILHQMGAVVDTALSGEEALGHIAQNRYDIVFMDHLMPGMDGMEATLKLRQTDPNVPVIALTANTVTGMKQLYLSNGMNDLLAKPIELPALCKILHQWLPGEKIWGREADGAPVEEEQATRLLLESLKTRLGLNVRDAIDKMGGHVESYLAILQTFLHVSPGKFAGLQKAYQKGRDTGEWGDFRVEIHGQKGSLANMGVTGLSAQARTMERMAAEGIVQSLEKLYEPFCSDLLAFQDTLRKLLPDKPTPEKTAPGDRNALEAPLRRMAGLIDDLDFDALEEQLTPLRSLRFDQETDQILQEAWDALNAFNYDLVKENIQKLQTSLEGEA